MADDSHNDEYIDLLNNPRQSAAETAFDARSRKQRRTDLFSVLMLYMLALGIGLFPAAFILPQFERLFDDWGGELPGLTRLMLGVSHWIGGSLPSQSIPGALWVIAMMIAAAVIVAFRYSTGHRMRGRAVYSAVVLGIATAAVPSLIAAFLPLINFTQGLTN